MTETGGTAADRQAERQADRTARTRARWVRWVVLGAVLVAMTAITLAHQKAHGAGRWAGVDFLCPFGGLETLYSLLAGGGFLRHTATSAVILLVGMLVMAVAFRRSFCGMLCPLGTLQGIFGAAGRRLFKRRLTVPAGVDRVARFLKYGVLAFFLLWTWQAAELVMRPYDPWVAWAHLTASRPAHHLSHRLRRPRRLPRRLARLRAFLLQVPLPRRGPARAPVEGELPEHQARRRDLHRLRPLRQGLHDERRGGDRRRGDELRVHLVQRVRQRLPRARRPQGHRGRRLARPRRWPPPAWSSRSWSPSSAPPRSPARSTGQHRRSLRRGRGAESQREGPAKAAVASTSCRSRATCRSPDIADDDRHPGSTSSAPQWGVPADALGLPLKDIKDQLRLHARGRPRLGGATRLAAVTGGRLGAARVSEAAGPC